MDFNGTFFFESEAKLEVAQNELNEFMEEWGDDPDDSYEIVLNQWEKGARIEGLELSVKIGGAFPPDLYGDFEQIVVMFSQHATGGSITGIMEKRGRGV